MHRPLILLGLVLFGLNSSFAEDEIKIESEKAAPPKETPEKILPRLSEESDKIASEEATIMQIWWVKDVPVKDPFKPTLQIKYPFAQGELLGVVQVPEDGSAADFRGQEIPAGVYTLRYGQQPVDGNHLGTSDVSDFCLLVSLEEDQDPAPLAPVEKLFKQSAKAAGTSHPAIFLLAPPPKMELSEKGIKHDKGKELWILEFNFPGKIKDKDQKVPFRLVVSGISAA